MARADLREWALKGAEQRLVEIAAEAARIHAEFPELRDSGQTTAPAPAVRPDRQPRRRKRRSLASRKRMAEAQRKRWAAVRGNSEGASKLPTAARKVVGKAPKKR